MKTALIIVDHGSKKAESNTMLEEVARLFAERHGEQFADVEPAHMELAEPSIETAYDRCVAKGAKHVVLLPFFLSRGRHMQRDIPSLLNEAAAKHTHTTYAIADPLGIDDLILDLLFKRATESATNPVIRGGDPDPALAGEEKVERRTQCAVCPFKVEPDGRIVDKRIAVNNT